MREAFSDVSAARRMDMQRQSVEESGNVGGVERRIAMNHVQKVNRFVCTAEEIITQGQHSVQKEEGRKK